MLPKSVIHSGVAFCLLAGASVARAEDPGPALAEAMFLEAKRLMAAGQIAEACDKLAESERIDPQTGTLLNLALCHEKLGRTATAWSEFGDVVSQAARKGEHDRERFARSHLASSEKVLSRVTLYLPPGVSAIEVDGQVLGQAGWSIALPLDPGDHTFTFSAPGKKPSVVRASVPVGPSSVRVAAPPLEEQSQGGPALVGPVPDASPIHGENSEGQPRATSGPTRTTGFVIGGIGLASVAAGGIFGTLALAKKGEVDNHCTGIDCDSAGYSAQGTAHTFATVSTITCAVGAVGLGVGAYLVFTAKTSPAKAGLRVGPVATSSGALLQLEGSL